MPRCAVTRRVHFNAAHRLFDPALSDTENAALFGPCSNPNYHGHNYELDITVEGNVDPQTGFVFDLKRLKDLIEQQVVEFLDHKNLNLDVPFLTGLNPTAENIAIACWKTLESAVKPAKLHRVRLWETPRHYVDYHGL